MEKEEAESQVTGVVAEFELHFSPKELVKSILREADGEIHETGVKGSEVRWQQGAIAVCLLAVYSRLRVLEGAEEPPILEGERGSPARSIDNLLNKPGDWALQMFGENRGQPRLREVIYRKRTVSRSNPVSAVQWDAAVLPPERIRIWQAGEELTSCESLKALVRTLVEEFNPRRAAKEWEALFPAPLEDVENTGQNGTRASLPATGVDVEEMRNAPTPPTDSAPSPTLSEENRPTPAPKSSLPPAFSEGGAVTREKPSRPAIKVLIAGATGVLLLVLGMLLGRSLLPSAPLSEVPLRSASAVEGFIDRLNAGDLEGAYALTSERFQAATPPEAFSVAYGEQRYNFPRLAGNPYRNTAETSAHDYRVALYVETRVHRIPPLEGLSRIPLTEIDVYAERISQLETSLRLLGLDEGVLNQLRKERLERPDASRHVQLVCGLSDDQLEELFPEEISTTLDLTLFFEVVEDPSGQWLIQSIEDASERLVAF
jgi:hypothetical protein